MDLRLLNKLSHDALINSSMLDGRVDILLDLTPLSLDENLLRDAYQALRGLCAESKQLREEFEERSGRLIKLVDLKNEAAIIQPLRRCQLTMAK